jgi:hypothetical protein
MHDGCAQGGKNPFYERSSKDQNGQQLPSHLSFEQTSLRKMATSFALFLNATAVTLLKHDDDMGMGLAKAVSIFRQAIQIVASSLATPIGTTDEIVTEAQEGSSHSLGNVPVSLNDNVGLLEESFSPNNSFCFYSKVFAIEAEAESSATHLQISSASSQVQLTATILYNWGVASHCMAICAGASCHVHMAMKLYNKALDVMTTTCNNNNNNDVAINDSLALLYLALVNNLGHCSSHLCDELMSRMCQERLKSALDTFRGGPEQKFNHDYSFFHEKTIVTMVNTFSAAA